MMGSLLNDEAAGCDHLIDELAEAIHWAIGVPRHIIEEFSGCPLTAKPK
jgi:hypothetical protein